MKLLRGVLFLLLFFFVIFYKNDVHANSILKLPFIKDEQMILTRGYNTPSTHINNDAFALDFTKNGCDGYGTPVLAVQDGTIIFLNTVDTYGRGYGLNVRVDHGAGLESRYAHLSSYNPLIFVDTIIKQGEVIGYQGDTGNVSGSACYEHPGTHLHFVMKFNSEPYKPEPMSGYTNFIAGKWYTSDNEMYDPNAKKVGEKFDVNESDKTSDGIFSSLWQKVKNIFTNDSPDDNEAEVKGEKIENKNEIQDKNKIQGETQGEAENEGSREYGASFLVPKIKVSGMAGTEARITVQAQNTGNIPWKASQVSINVIGGREANQKYRHPDWITDLRPARLAENTVEPRSTGTFTFPIRIPAESGETILSLQIVHQEGINFLQIGTDVVQVRVVSESPSLEKKKTEIPLISKEKIQEHTQKAVQKIEDIFDVIVDGTVRGIKIFSDSIPAPFPVPTGGGGGEGGVVDVPRPLPEIPTNQEEEEEIAPPVVPPVEVPEIIPDVPVEAPVFAPEIEEASSSTAPIITDIVTSKVDGAIPTIQVSWQFQDAEDDLDYFQLQRKIDEDEWSMLVEYTTSTEFLIAVEMEREYMFRIRGVDRVGNVSEWSMESGATSFTLPRTVVINEIAWMGTGPGQATADEWLELYNASHEAIDMSDWRLRLNGQEVLWTKVKPTLQPESYLVIERGNDTPLSGVSAGGFFQITGGLADQGGRLELFDPTGRLIDQVDAQVGWFAGSQNQNYRSMARIEATQAGNLTNNWITTNFATPITAGRGGIPVFGSPGRANQGSVLFKNVVPYASHLMGADKTLRLTADQSPYFIDASVEVPVGYTLIIEEGVVLVGMHRSSYINVKGSLILAGTEQKPIIFTSARDLRYVKENLSSVVGNVAQSGDWSHIEVASTGQVQGNFVHFLYGGYPYTRGSGWVYGSKEFAQVITSFGGRVDLNNSRFEQSLVHNRDADYNSVVWLQKNSQALIHNSAFAGGFMAVKQDDGGSLHGNNNVFQGFQHSEGPVSLQGQAVMGENNTFMNNVFDGVSLRRTVIDQSVSLPASSKYIASNIDVLPTGHLTVQPGVQLLMRARADINVRGQLSVLGLPEQKVEVRPAVTSTYWGSLFFDESTSTVQFATFSGGNHSTIDSGRDNGVVQLQNSVVDFDHVQLLDARRPYNMIFAKNSYLGLRNSRVAWSTAKENQSWFIIGIKIVGGKIHLDNTFFQHLDRGVEGSNNASGTLINTLPGHFLNILQQLWFPVGLFAF